MMSKKIKKIINIIPLVLVIAMILYMMSLPLNIKVVYAKSKEDLLVTAYNTLSKDQKEIINNNINNIIKTEWSKYILDEYNIQIRIDELMESKYVDEKMFTKKYTYKLGKVSTPSNISGFIWYLNKYFSSEWDYEEDSLNDEEYEILFYDRFYRVIEDIINNNNSNSVTFSYQIKYFVDRCNEMKKHISETIVGDEKYFNIEYSTKDLTNELEKQIIGLDVVRRPDITYNDMYDLSNEKFIKLILDENIIK